MKAYIASGFFNEQQILDIEIIKQACKNVGLEFYSPKDEVVANPNDGLESRQKVFQANINAIQSCGVVIANTRDKDVGTVWEAGFAFGITCPVIYYFSDRDKFNGFNLMLAESGIAVCNSLTDLQDVLTMFINNNCNYHRPYLKEIQ